MACSRFYLFVYVILVLLKDTRQQQSAVCTGIIATLDCSADPPSPVCGTQGVTFPTRCNFAKAHCKDNNIHLVHDGECLPAEKPLTDPICPQLTNFTCPAANSLQVCASNGSAFANLCEFQKARCQTPALQLLSLGPCVTTVASTTLRRVPVLDLICKAIENQVCPDDVSPVCGSDSVTYNNACLLEKTACTTPGLHLVHEHPC